MTEMTEKTCELHRAVITTRLESVELQTKSIFAEIEEVRNLQKMILYALIFIAMATICTLLGVILGRGLDFGWLII